MCYLLRDRANAQKKEILTLRYWEVDYRLHSNTITRLVTLVIRDVEALAVGCSHRRKLVKARHGRLRCASAGGHDLWREVWDD